MVSQLGPFTSTTESRRILFHIISRVYDSHAGRAESRCRNKGRLCVIGYPFPAFCVETEDRVGVAKSQSPRRLIVKSDLGEDFWAGYSLRRANTSEESWIHCGRRLDRRAGHWRLAEFCSLFPVLRDIHLVRHPNSRSQTPMNHKH
jgi:hypothetical protein